MAKYDFYYDESEHSRKINLKTVSADNYYDCFISGIVGWKSDYSDQLSAVYKEFEKKYCNDDGNSELKSHAFKSKHLRNGFASLNKNTIQVYEKFLDVFDDNIITYIAISSKFEFVISQIFREYQSNLLFDAELMKYSIIKALNVYRPQNVIKAMYESPESLVKEMRLFFADRIERNKENLDLKDAENNSFEQILIILNEIDEIQKLDWQYYSQFTGFKKMLEEAKINEYSLVIDREGADRTVHAALDVGLNDVTDEDSKNSIGVRVVDMFVGLVSHMMKILSTSLTNSYDNAEVKKTLLPEAWFVLDERQLTLYKKLHKIICKDNAYWYSTYAGIYSDDLIAFISLLQYMDQFDSVEELRKIDGKKHSEYYNSTVLEGLRRHYHLIGNKLPIEPALINDEEKCVTNNKGAKVYLDPQKNKELEIKPGKNEYLVLSVGFMGTFPMVTIQEKNRVNCYRLPIEYSEWAEMVVAMANRGINYFPEKVVFSRIHGKYYADIL